MWQLICLCLPAVTHSEQQRFFTLFKEVLRAYGREPGEMDISLFFLYALSPEEALTVLEERLDLVVRSQELLTICAPCWQPNTNGYSVLLYSSNIDLVWGQPNLERSRFPEHDGFPQNAFIQKREIPMIETTTRRYS